MENGGAAAIYMNGVSQLLSGTTFPRPCPVNCQRVVIGDSRPLLAGALDDYR